VKRESVNVKRGRVNVKRESVSERESVNESVEKEREGE